MARSTFSLLLMAVIVGSAISFPPQTTRYDNIPQCLQPAVSGLCLAYFPSWYYNPSTEKCETFIYGGCEGNANRFISEEECMQKCGGFKLENKEFKLKLETDDVNPESEKLVENDDQQVGNDDQQVGNDDQQVGNDDQQVGNDGGVSVCALESKTGPCRGQLKRFYFNGGKCEEFIFGGCQGNGNNFNTVEECKQICETGVSDEGAISGDQTEDKVNEEVAPANKDE